MSEAQSRDMAIVRRMLAGDARAFEEFFESHFSRLFRFALVRLEGKVDAAEEVAQAALCAAMTRLETYRGESALFTWLCAICRHEIWRHYERLGRQPAFASLPEESEEARAALESLAVASEQWPEASLHRKEIARLVQVTLDNLPWSYAAALEWKYLQEVPVKEIAARLSLSLKAAESLLGRARAAFKDSFTTVVAPTGGPTGGRTSTP